MQKKAVDNVLSKKFKSTTAAMVDAGYSRKSARPSELFERKGVQWYLSKVQRQFAKKIPGFKLPDKVMNTYVEGLDATKLVGKDAVEHPDYATRKIFADTLAEFFGWKKAVVASATQQNQFNFFSVPQEKQADFNSQFRGFLKHFYK